MNVKIILKECVCRFFYFLRCSLSYNVLMCHILFRWLTSFVWKWKSWRQCDVLLKIKKDFLRKIDVHTQLMLSENNHNKDS